MDTLTPQQRSERMRLIRAKDTKPEIIVRRLLHSMGYRYRIHVAALPGRPDIVFPGRRKVIFVHGCFWHLHDNCGRAPKSRLEYWMPKLEGNRARDHANVARLAALGWDVLVVWECAVKDLAGMTLSLRAFLDGSNRPPPRG